MRRLLLLLLGCLVLTSAACQKIAFEKELKLPKGAPYLEVEFKAPKGEQSVSVSVSGGGAALRVYLVLADDKDEVINALLRGIKPRRVLAAGEGNDSVRIDGKVTGGKPFVVLIQPVKPPDNDVELKVAVSG
jgi:hypothetical protein